MKKDIGVEFLKTLHEEFDARDTKGLITHKIPFDDMAFNDGYSKSSFSGLAGGRKLKLYVILVKGDHRWGINSEYTQVGDHNDGALTFTTKAGARESATAIAALFIDLLYERIACAYYVGPYYPHKLESVAFGEGATVVSFYLKTNNRYRLLCSTSHWMYTNEDRLLDSNRIEVFDVVSESAPDPLSIALLEKLYTVDPDISIPKTLDSLDELVTISAKVARDDINQDKPDGAEVTFYIYFKKDQKKSATDFAKEASKNGFSKKVSLLDHDGGQWSVVLGKMFTDEDAVTNAEEWLMDLSEEYDGEYDGNEVAVG